MDSFVLLSKLYRQRIDCPTTVLEMETKVNRPKSVETAPADIDIVS